MNGHNVLFNIQTQYICKRFNLIVTGPLWGPIFKNDVAKSFIRNNCIMVKQIMYSIYTIYTYINIMVFFLSPVSFSVSVALRIWRRFDRSKSVIFRSVVLLTFALVIQVDTSSRAHLNLSTDLKMTEVTMSKRPQKRNDRERKKNHLIHLYVK